MKFCFDTNIFIGRLDVPLRTNLYFSSIVLAELMSGADRTRAKDLESWRRYSEKFGRLLVPDADDWWEAGKVLQRLSQTSKRENFGSTPKLSPAERVRLFNDVLLAVGCRRNGITLITDNLKDFERVQSACRVKVRSGDEHFVDEAQT